MTHYKCEEISSCTNFQSAICLHCNRRLCLDHITEHNQGIPSNIQNLLNEVEKTSKQINNEHETSRETYNQLVKSLNQWRTEQTEKIQQYYDSYLQTIESKQEALNIIQQDLTDLLDRDARQPLKYLHKQQNTHFGIINRIRETIEKAKQNSTKLKWNSSISLPENIVSDPKDSLSTVSSISTPKSNNNSIIPKNKFSSHIMINLRKYRAFRRLVEMFANISCIEQSKADIATYLTMQGPNFKLPSLISSYLTAWHKTVKENEKLFLLNQHISTIQKHTAHIRHNYVNLFGIHAFFYNENIQENKRDMMTFLLQYFIDHQCLNRHHIISWYNSRDLHGYEGFDGIKQLTAPFLKTLWVNNKVTDVQPVTINVTTVVEQSDNVQIKEEPDESVKQNIISS